MALSERAVTSLAFTAVQFTVALACAVLVTRRHGLSIGSGLVVLWYTFDCIVHVTLVSAACMQTAGAFRWAAFSIRTVCRC